MKAGKIETPLLTVEWGTNPHAAEWERLKRLQRFAQYDKVKAKQPIATSINGFDIPADNPGVVKYVGTCEVYEVLFTGDGWKFHVMCIADELKKF